MDKRYNDIKGSLSYLIRQWIGYDIENMSLLDRRIIPFKEYIAHLNKADFFGTPNSFHSTKFQLKLLLRV